MAFNHVIDPTYFFDAIEEFAFDYDCYVLVNKGVVDDYGRRTKVYEKQTIRGSLQSNETAMNRSKEGNVIEDSYNFYCKSLYRIDVGDFIHYQDKWLLCYAVSEYDAWGCREVKLQTTQLAQHKDLQEYIKFLEGEEII